MTRSFEDGHRDNTSRRMSPFSIYVSVDKVERVLPMDIRQGAPSLQQRRVCATHGSVTESYSNQEPE